VSRPVIALLGAGEMGSKHARVIAESADAELGVIVDRDPRVAARLATMYGTTPSTCIDDAAKADAVILATSTACHPECLTTLIEAGVPVLVEKPVASDFAEVSQLLELAARHDVPIMCGFVERFNAAFITALRLLTDVPDHVLTVRHSPPAPRIASSVVNDILLHDLDLVLGLFQWKAAAIVGAASYRPPTSSWCELVDCIVSFDGGGIASLSASRMGQRKVRSLSIHAGGQLVEVDLLRQDVSVCRNVSQEMMLTDGEIAYRSSTEVDIPFVRHAGEPLALQFAHFLGLINGSVDPTTERDHIRPDHHLADRVEAMSTSP